jgi:DNA-binding transcriptional MerR regulator
MSHVSSADPPVRRQRRDSPPVREQLHPIGDVAREFGVTLRTLRFYEDKGLISPYRNGNARLYRESDRAKIALILKGKKLGFTLGEIRESLAANSRKSGAASLALKPEQILSQIAHLTRQREDIEQAIAQLRAAHAHLASEI